MTGRVLVVDDVVATLKLLEVQLASEYLEVVTARDGAEALQLLASTRPDVVLLDVLMPGIDGFEVCRKIKSNPATTHVPVVMISNLDQSQDRVKALEAGADDFITKPVNPSSLMARVRSLVRYKIAMDELRMREQTGRDLGLSESEEATVLAVDPHDGRVLLIESRDEVADQVRRALDPLHKVHVERDAQDALLVARRSELDLIIVSLDLEGVDGLRVVSQLRSSEESRRTPLLALAGKRNHERLVRALEIGANGFVKLPLEPNEMLARAEAQIRSKRYRDYLGQNMRASLEKAIRDPLTGMHNRRYLDNHLREVVALGVERGRPVSLLMIDIDHFKALNDTWGHDVGDQVLRETAQRLSDKLRGLDLCCRYGGEEFVAVFSGSDRALARTIAERLRAAVADKPFSIQVSGEEITVTISVGLATLEGQDDTAEQLLKRADLALYRAKKEGRNRVVDAA